MTKATEKKLQKIREYYNNQIKAQGYVNYEDFNTYVEGIQCMSWATFKKYVQYDIQEREEIINIFTIDEMIDCLNNTTDSKDLNLDAGFWLEREGEQIKQIYTFDIIIVKGF